eukprot:CAMPEP_0197597524 /NCGR_PEP_ID=MMETSP1326-20131121/27512_1 /TAXON_ID=1155430 /ORGANISM="Genus nov. species nov., Strain RCC2288" /LENGTH=265 /DNA_ID=CAMNT_0043164213 /DNA_START=43 /DNA_END=840 /DNA_ORIENTATION=-
MSVFTVSSAAAPAALSSRTHARGVAKSRQQRTTKPNSGKIAATSASASRDDGAAAGPSLGQRAAAAFAAVSLTLSSAAALPPPAMAGAPKSPDVYVAELIPTKGSKVGGSFTFVSGQNKSYQEVVTIQAKLTGLAPGLHGINIHATGGDLACDDGACTGVSYNPQDRPHGKPDALRKFGASACHFVGEGCLLWRHIGDLGNVTADDAGLVNATFKDDYLSLKKGEANVAGRSIVIRSGADDFVTFAEDGGAGPILAYGVLKPVVS